MFSQLWSDVEPQVSNNYDEFLKWLNNEYGKHGSVQSVRRPKHNYLGTNFDFSTKVEVNVDMFGHDNGNIDGYPAIFD